MTRLSRPQSIRTRLTVWYLCVFSAVLLLFWGLTASFLFFQLRGQLDHYAIQDIETIEGLLYFDSSGHLAMHEDYHNHPESRAGTGKAGGGAVTGRQPALSQRTLA
jgi:hypothetical protein